MRRQNQHRKYKTRKTSFWKKAGGYLISLRWVDWMKRATWLLRTVAPFFPIYVLGWLPEWVDIGQINEMLILTT